MPPKKKCTPKARKAELVFLERPPEGPVHCYEAPLPSAKNPRRVPTKPVDQNASAVWVGIDYFLPLRPTATVFKFLLRVSTEGDVSWILKVCPQFETTKSVVSKECQKNHRGPRKPQNQGGKHSSLHPGGASHRAAASKFPPLTFQTPEGHAVHPSDNLNHVRKNPQHSHSLPKKQTATKANIQVNSPENCKEIPSLPAPQPVEPEICGLPHLETAQTPSMRNWGCSSTLAQTSSPAWHPEAELAHGIGPCGSGDSAAVLVTDTPEHEYGVKVTWRRRPHLMKYLLERGKLSAANILVSPELSRRQANV